jgi:hypothetical protein
MLHNSTDPYRRAPIRRHSSLENSHESYLSKKEGKNTVLLLEVSHNHGTPELVGINRKKEKGLSEESKL